MFKILIALLLLTSVCYAQEKTLEVKTGYGYFKDADNHIIAKAELPKGKHPLKGNYTYTEVSSKETLDAVQVYVTPKTDEEIKQELIAAEIKEILDKQAIDSLKIKGQLDEKGELKKEK